jgi:hypothetical protein
MSLNPNAEDLLDLATSATAPLKDDEEAKAMRSALLRVVLPECQPQEASPPNTFTKPERELIAAALTTSKFRPRDADDVSNAVAKLMDLRWEDKPNEKKEDVDEPPREIESISSPGQPEAEPFALPRLFREEVRQGRFTGPTNGQCPGYLQCNLVVLDQEYAFDFLLFCQRNPQACPLLEVCEAGSFTPTLLAPDADLRTDIPKYVGVSVSVVGSLVGNASHLSLSSFADTPFTKMVSSTEKWWIVLTIGRKMRWLF